MAGPDRSRIGFLARSQTPRAPELVPGKTFYTGANQDPDYSEEATCLGWGSRCEPQPLSQVDSAHSRQSLRRGPSSGVGREAEQNGQENPPYSVDFTNLNCVPRAPEEFISRNLG